MTLRDAFATALGNLSLHKMRSALAMLGVVFGVGAVIAMLSIGAGAEQESLALIQRLGVDNILVRARDYDEEQLQEIRRSSVGLAQRDIDAILAAVPDVEAVAPKLEIEAWGVRSRQGESKASVFGVDQRHHVLQDLRLREGRFLDGLDVRDHAQVCVIGARVRYDLFGWLPAVGAEIKINEVWLTVVGVLEDRRGEADSFQGVSLASFDDAVYLPVSTALRKFDRDPLESPLTEMVIRIRPGDRPERTSLETAAAVGRLLEQLHAGVEDYEMIVPQALLDQARQTRRIFNAIMGSIAGVSLLVGGLGIMNVMLASVLERTREIGVRRAIGASKRDIRIQFLIESFSISALGGLTGTLLGIALAFGIATYAGWPTTVSLVAIALSIVVAVGVGIGSGLYPAMQAAELDPIAALRYE